MKFTYLTLSVLLPTALVGMELQEHKKGTAGNEQQGLLESRTSAASDVAIDFSDEHHNSAHLSADLVRSIKGGKVSQLRSMLTQQKTRAGNAALDVTNNMDQLGSALGLAQGELALQQDLMAKGLFDHFMTRYKHVAIPAFLTAASLANLIANAYDYARPDPAVPASQQNTGSFAINMAASGLAAIGFGYRTIKEIRKAILDTRQKKLVEQLETSHLYLQKLHELAMKDGVITPQEQTGINAAQQQQAQLQSDLALVNAELETIAKEEAAGGGQQGSALVTRKGSVVKVVEDYDKTTGKQDVDLVTPAATLVAGLVAVDQVAPKGDTPGSTPTLEVTGNPAFGVDTAAVDAGASNNNAQGEQGGQGVEGQEKQADAEGDKKE